jgi:hypothetical protein
MMLKREVPHKLTLTMHYSNTNEFNGMLDRVKSLVKNGSICHEEKHGINSRYVMEVENMDNIDILEKFNILEEPEFVEVTPRVEIINGKKCLIYRSNMDSFV